MKKKIRVNITNKTKKYKIIRKRLLEFTKNLIKTLKIKDDVDLSIAFVGAKTITEINKKFRNVDKPTNVISFNLCETKDSLCSALAGEIIICPYIAGLEVKRSSNNFHDYIEFLIIHGFLHIIGYDHDTKTNRITMENLEEKIFKNTEVKNFILKEVL
jgi:probable rRNA maturation factor